MQFEPFPKMPRLSRDVTITEKIDGSNAQVTIVRDDTGGIAFGGQVDEKVASVGVFHVFAGSRNRWVTPLKDNFGFAKWVYANAAELVATLGEGTHFGEWWGSGIQRNYGQSEKHFSLFNTKRWGTHFDDQGRVGCCRVVPTLYQGPLDNHEVLVGVRESIRRLRRGSVAAPGFMKPEGIIIFHHAGNFCFKKTLDKDEEPKGLAKTRGNYKDDDKLESIGQALGRIAHLIPDDPAYHPATEALFASGKEAMERHAAEVLNEAFVTERAMGGR